MNDLDRLIFDHGFSLTVDDALIIRGISLSKHHSSNFYNYLNENILSLFKDVFQYGKTTIPQIESILNDAFKHLKHIDEEIFIQKDKDQSLFYAFVLSADVIKTSDGFLCFLHIDDFKEVDKAYKINQPIFNEIDQFFPIFKSYNQMARLVFEHGPKQSKLIVDEQFNDLFEIENTHQLEHFIANDPFIEHKDKTLILHQDFYEKFSLYLENQIEKIVDDIKVQDKWIRFEIVAYERDKSTQRPLKSVGIAFNITDIISYTNAKYIQSLYDLAIQSGHIGVFYYDVQKHTDQWFVANDIYAEMFGLKPNEEGLYSAEDFVASILDVEPDLTENNVLDEMYELLEGTIEGTVDDLLKIKHLKTGEIKYLLSSSKIESRFENDKPKVFGGVVIDITNRISREKSEREKTLMDNLTGLGNNRKLEKDLHDVGDGFGIFIDLDHFKKINDTYGHKTGDALIVIFSEILRRVKSEAVKVYRLYGDEFFVYIEGKEKSWVDDLMKRIDQLTNQFNETSEYEIELSSSKGISVYHAGDDIDEFIKQCDYAMYREKIKKHGQRHIVRH